MKSTIFALIACACIICFSPAQVRAQKNDPLRDIEQTITNISKRIEKIGRAPERVIKSYTRLKKVIEDNTPKEGEFMFVNAYPENFITVVELKTMDSEVTSVLAPGESTSLPAVISPTDKKELVCGFVKVYYFEQYAPARDNEGNYVYNADGSHVYGDAIFMGSYDIKDYLTFREPLQSYSTAKNKSRYVSDVKKQSKMYKEQYEAETGEAAQ
jgi:hypothetical protein